MNIRSRHKSYSFLRSLMIQNLQSTSSTFVVDAEMDAFNNQIDVFDESHYSRVIVDIIVANIK